MDSQWKDKIFAVTQDNWKETALAVFRFQYAHNPVYRDYTDALQRKVASVNTIEQIPFLPIRFFKTHAIRTTDFAPSLHFESSGTTGMANSRHYIKDTSVYQESFLRGFELFYGNPAGWCIIGLLPSYLERRHSSLVYMVNELIRRSGHAASGFYLQEFEKLANTLTGLEKAKQKTLLIGVTFALLDFAEQYPMPLKHTIVMETGGMKGRREELVRPQVHQLLETAFGLPSIHSEYGMTELLSQAYSQGHGIFHTPPWMKIVLRDEEDPLHLTIDNSTGSPVAGAINVIDLANLYSCSFIATDDAGRVYEEGGFEVLGRLDHSDLRGCSLLAV